MAQFHNQLPYFIIAVLVMFFMSLFSLVFFNGKECFRGGVLNLLVNWKIVTVWIVQGWLTLEF